MALSMTLVAETSWALSRATSRDCRLSAVCDPRWWRRFWEGGRIFWLTGVSLCGRKFSDYAKKKREMCELGEFGYRNKNERQGQLCIRKWLWTARDFNLWCRRRDANQWNSEEQGEKMVPSYIPVAVSCSVIKIKLEQLWDEEYYGICKFCIPQSLQ